jgi:hypothetical protein
MRNALYSIVEETLGYIIIKDIGAGTRYMSVTNAAEQVVNELLPRLKGRRLYYYDSDGRLDQLEIKDNKFTGFCRGGPKPTQP